LAGRCCLALVVACRLRLPFTPFSLVLLSLSLLLTVSLARCFGRKRHGRTSVVASGRHASPVNAGSIVTLDLGRFNRLFCRGHDLAKDPWRKTQRADPVDQRKNMPSSSIKKTGVGDRVKFWGYIIISVWGRNS